MKSLTGVKQPGMSCVWVHLQIKIVNNRGGGGGGVSGCGIFHVFKP